MTFDITGSFAGRAPEAGEKWAGNLPYSFVGGHNDGGSVPFGGLAEAATTALARHGADLASYNLGGSPQGHLGLRQVIADKLGRRASTPVDPDEVLLTSGSLQALDLVNGLFLERGDCVIVEEATYGGTLTKLASRGVEAIGVQLDEDGIRPDHLSDLLVDLDAKGRKPKFLYTIPTVQNPTGSVMPAERRLEILDIVRRHGVAIFEDDCYADLVFDGSRPPTFRALDDGGGQVVYCGSFSKSIAPSLRVGYVVADWEVIGRLLAMKTDAGSGALEQIVLAEYAQHHFDAHVGELASTLQQKCAVMCSAVQRSFGEAAQFVEPRGGIFVWLALPDGVDTAALAGPAQARGVEFNPGAGWSVDPAYGSRRLRLCFGHPSADTIEEGVGILAEVVAAETGLTLPAR